MIATPLAVPGALAGCEAFAWVTDPPEAEWDRLLADLAGHPLQSAAWGGARVAAGEPRDLRLVAMVGGMPQCMARIERRRVPLLGQAAWIPKGPAYAPGADKALLHAALLAQLRVHGFILALETPYRPGDVAPAWRHRGPDYQTIVVDLERQSEAVWASLPGKLRSQIRSAERKGVVVRETSETEHVSQFYELCSRVSETKGFDLPGSRELMLELLRAGRVRPGAGAGATLVAAFSKGQLIAGHVFMRVGRSTHTLWAGHDRERGISGASDLVVWQHMRDAIAAGCTRFDQEGIDKERNPTTYAFKRKFGGVECDVPGLHAYPLNLRGRLALAAARRMGKL